MGRLMKVYLDTRDLYRCVQCHSHLAYTTDLEATTFRSGIHRAFLFTSVVNVYTAPKVDRPLTTGLHTVSDLYCGGCDVEVGWFYNFAYEQSQKYKENKFILIENRIVQDDKPPSAQPHTASPSSSSSSSASSLRHSHLPHTPSSHSSHSSHFSSSDPHPSLALVGMEDDDEEDEEDEDGEEEEEEGLSTASVGHGHHLPPVSWTELTAIVGAELTGEGGRRRAIPPAEMRVRMRSARSAHSGHM